VVRTRYVQVKLAKKVLDELGTQAYPQRDAVLFALRKLTGQDPGTTTEAWLETFPRAEQDASAARLSRQLLQASAYRRDVLLNKLRDAKGVVNTMALAIAIPSLEGKAQEKARSVLEERLTRMTTKSLRHKLKDEDLEVRRAAVAATVRKEKKELVPELIGLLADSEPVTAKAAEAALKDLTGQQFPTPADWQKWWQKQ
jgi:HEAT repeat protein